ncbi:MAG: hypothetical protein NWT00_01830 [Beijerinckiaceae bacterium]|nr:hypothetical protein [Beijerinckiaceae bacterium]
MKRFAFLIPVFCLLANPAAAGSSGGSAAEKASLQAAMFQHIDQQLVRGSFLHVDFKRGEVEKLSPAKAHPMMLTMGNNYVLCTTFRRQNGTEVNIDFYAAKKEAGYSIFHTEVNNRGPLMALIKAGKVKPLK